ncbi:GAK system CofD-like protein [Desulfovibrio sp. JC022]|uniref:GAK system CofD-like protein n=1 Tax=Desulfovibrio sp. JC022 TaxID=2593642 RepID=UPI0013D6DD55|nr:GAK system CofD-like protein [Desulfovibrio sp. JC022]NDV22872.1 GAK system CofD-like protein [Desulfovibrio sp. JC022]
MRIKIEREVRVPDPIKLERYRRTPDLGPRILFFSGGTALKKTSSVLTQYTHNSIHIITPFDSGGSSAVIRNQFKMLAVGDIRNRLMALADQSVLGNPEIYKLFAYRLPDDADEGELRTEFEEMMECKHPLVRDIPAPMRKIIRNHFIKFADIMDDFNLRGASVGNIILTAGYISNRRHIDPVLYIFSKLVEVRGIVRPTVNMDIHLAAELEDGTFVVGQHLLTGKEASPIGSGIKKLWLAEKLGDSTPCSVPIRNRMKKLIKSAELICYPLGSFYSSVVANLLPEGIGNAISDSRCPKVFTPNTGTDPELKGHSLTDQINKLLYYLRKDDPENISIKDVLNFVLVDSVNGIYPGGVDKNEINKLGIQVIDCELVSNESTPYLDPHLLSQALLSLA